MQEEEKRRETVFKGEEERGVREGDRFQPDREVNERTVGMLQRCDVAFGPHSSG